MKNVKLLLATTAVGLVMGFSSAQAEIAVANIKGTAPDSKISGTASFMDTQEGLSIKVSVANAPVGKHGFHIHEFGSCEDLGKAAGGHFNPMNSPHGMVTKDGVKKAHGGDLGNMEVAADGTGKLEAVIHGVTLSQGKSNVAGRAVILHEKEDDFGQPVGNAGGRIGCGQIIIIGK